MAPVACGSFLDNALDYCWVQQWLSAGDNHLLKLTTQVILLNRQVSSSALSTSCCCAGNQVPIVCKYTSFSFSPSWEQRLTHSVRRISADTPKLTFLICDVFHLNAFPQQLFWGIWSCLLHERDMKLEWTRRAWLRNLGNVSPYVVGGISMLLREKPYSYLCY